MYLLTQHDAERLFLPIRTHEDIHFGISYTKVKEAGPLRQIAKGPAKVAEAPTEADWEQAAVYRITLPLLPPSLREGSGVGLGQGGGSLLSIDYQGDCARLYANGKLIADHFQYGRPFLYGLWRLPKDCNELELRIMPLQANAPIYLPREADATPGEAVKSITVTNEGL